jgi:thiol:disulfide interchange protein DsbD
MFAVKQGRKFAPAAAALLLTASLSAAAVNPNELLEPEKAFRITARALDERNAEVEFRIAKGYYMYRNRFSFASESGKPLAEVEIPRGTEKVDEFFGRTETFRDLVRIRVPLSPADAKAGSVNLKVTSQGCADVGVCYAPLEQTVRVDFRTPPRQRGSAGRAFPEAGISGTAK